MKTNASKNAFETMTRAAGHSGMSTKERLLKSAGILFASKGFREVSVREIAAHAGVNSALVGYYFRGKQALFNEVYRAQASPLAEERMRRLSAVLEKNGNPTVEEIVRAWVLPWLQIKSDKENYELDVRFASNLSGERWEHTRKAAPYVQRSHTAFINALQKCLPHLSRETLMWRLHFIVGAITFGLRVPGPLRAFSKGHCDPENLEMAVAQMIPYAVAGFNAPEPQIESPKNRTGKATASGH